MTRKLLLAIVAVLCPFAAHATTITSNGTGGGNWSATSTWSGAVVPASPVAITNAANNGSGAVRITLATSATYWANNDRVNVYGITGTTEGNGSWLVTRINVSSTVYDLQGTSFVNNYVSGGTGFHGDVVSFVGGDTVTLDAAATDANFLLIIGTDPVNSASIATNGNAILCPIAATGAAMNVNANIQLRVRGNIFQAGDEGGSFGPRYFTFASGSSLIFDPPAGSTYSYTFRRDAILQTNGTANSRCTVKTDTSRGGGAARIHPLSDDPTTSGWGGVAASSYTDFSNLYDPSGVNMGLVGVANNSAFTNISPYVYNCTFSTTSYEGQGNTGWDANFTFTGNIFKNSVGSTQLGFVNTGAYFGFATTAVNGVRTIDSSSFDLFLLFAGVNQVHLTNTYMGNGTFAFSGTWGDDSHYLNNFTLRNGDTDIYGSAKDSYFLNTAPNNPHFLTLNASTQATTITGMIFESQATAGGGSGDCIFPVTNNTGTPTLLVQKCIVLPDSTGNTSGKLVSALNGPNTQITADHNTYQSAGGEAGLIQLDETTSGYVGEVASARANLVWSSATSTHGLAIYDNGSGTPAVDAVHIAGYNSFWNPNTGTCFYNTSTSQSGVTGYDGVKVSVNHVYPSTSVGTGDMTANPQFVDLTRNLAHWGGTAAGGGIATVAAATATIAANPLLIGQATTGLLAWIRAGFQPTNISLEAASFPGDTSTTDAAGNAWPGGSPGIGAMAYTTAASNTTNGASVLMGH